MNSINTPYSGSPSTSGPASGDLPSIQGLTTFAIVARHHSFSSAADELEIGQSAVSHAIRQLERWFGCALFDRDHRGIRLTDEGRILAEIDFSHSSAPDRAAIEVGTDGFPSTRRDRDGRRFR